MAWIWATSPCTSAPAPSSRCGPSGWTSTSCTASGSTSVPRLVAKIRRTRERGGRVAAGTTVVRALESALRDGEVQPFAGETQIFIFPGYRIRSIDALITNFHLPESTLLMLVSALAGREPDARGHHHVAQPTIVSSPTAMPLLILPDGATATEEPDAAGAAQNR